MPSNCGPGEDSWESIGLHGIKPINPKGNQPQIFIERTDTEARVPIIWPPDAKSQLTGRPWCWERVKAKEEGSRRWVGNMVLPTQRTWIWANSRR